MASTQQECRRASLLLLGVSTAPLTVLAPAVPVLSLRARCSSPGRPGSGGGLGDQGPPRRAGCSPSRWVLCCVALWVRVGAPSLGCRRACRAPVSSALASVLKASQLWLWLGSCSDTLQLSGLGPRVAAGAGFCRPSGPGRKRRAADPDPRNPQQAWGGEP